MWECAAGVILLPDSLVRGQVKHLLELFPAHEDVSVQERVTTDIATEPVKHRPAGQTYWAVARFNANQVRFC